MTGVQYFHFCAELWGAIFCIVAAACAFMIRYFDKSSTEKLINLMMCACMLMLCDAFAWWYRGDTSPLGYQAVRAANFFAFVFGFLAMPLTAEYVSGIIKKRAGNVQLYWKNLEWILFVVGVILLTLNTFYDYMYSFDENNRYYRLPFSFIPGFIAFVGIIITLGVAVKYVGKMNRFERAAVILFLILPVIGVIIQTFNYGISLTYLMLVLSSLILFFSHIYNFMQYNIEKEKELAEERIRVFNQQIQPHFIFNSLSLIRHLCKNSPDEAVEAINEFSGYLRNCTDFINESDCIPASRDFDLVKHYIYMEQKRFGKSISVKYDLEDADFSLPPFSVQTSVENAIKHGLRAVSKKDGQLTISSCRKGKDHIVVVEDNGAGFDTRRIKSDSSSHVGIINTKKRLELMCGGDIYIESSQGKGTKVIITIPGTDVEI